MAHAPPHDPLVVASAAIAACDVTGFDNDQLVTTTNAARQLQRAVDALLVRIGQRGDELAQSGVGAPASDTLLGSGQVSARQARAEADRVTTASRLPALGDALDNGTIAAQHIDVVTRAFKGLDPDERDELAACQTEMAAAAARLPVDTFRRHVSRLVDEIRGDQGEETLDQQRARSEARLWTSSDGMGHLHATLDPERFESLSQALDRHMRSLSKAGHEAEHGRPLTLDGNLAVGALFDLVLQANGRHGRPHIILVTDSQTGTTETVDGTPLPPSATGEHSCDAVVHTVTVDDSGLPLSVGRSERTATPAQWKALLALHRTCAWYGCDRPVSWCQAHHIDHWEHGGPTDLDNLVPLCHQHHQRVHRQSWHLRLSPDRALHIFRPDGELWQTAEPDRLRTSDDAHRTPLPRRSRPGETPRPVNTPDTSQTRHRPDPGHDPFSDQLSQ